jgi:CHAD domain-containing protein
MEIEAKFALPDAETLRHLQAIDHLAGFALSTGQIKQIRDTYLDTADRLILAAGYACRRRERGEEVLITLKGLGGAEGAVHRREELQVALPSDQPPTERFDVAHHEWPASPVRDRVLQLIGEAPLAPLVDLQQTRVVRLVSQGERPVAELSLDEVHLAADEREQTYFELEAELAPQGSEDDLTTIVTCLQDEWGLEPETRSKFERALAFLEQPAPSDGLLKPQEQAVLRQTATRDDMYGRRARALLSLDEGATQAKAGANAGLSARTVRYWLARFRKRHLDIFPDRILAAAQPAPSPEPEPPPEPEELPQPPEAPIVRPTPKKSPKKPPKKPGLEADDAMAEAARKTFYFHFQRMLYHEPGTRLGEDIEELHDMRVATRRMRAAFRVFGDYLDTEQLKPVLKGLRRTGRVLGAVRDLDVFWEKTQHYLDTLPPAQQDSLAPLRQVWEAEREQARARMLVYLDSDRYARFKERFGEFLQTSDAGALPVFSEKGEPLPYRLRHVVPVVMHQRLAAVQAYDEWVTGPDVPLERLHRLRIAAKGLRYTLEFFQEVLGPEAKPLIQEMKDLQDHLGDLQDAVVASGLLRDFLTWGTWGHAQAKRAPLPTQTIVAPGVAAYLAARQTELQHLLDTFPQAWAHFYSPQFKQAVAVAVAPL